MFSFFSCLAFFDSKAFISCVVEMWKHICCIRRLRLGVAFGVIYLDKSVVEIHKQNIRYISKCLSNFGGDVTGCFSLLCDWHIQTPYPYVKLQLTHRRTRPNHFSTNTHHTYTHVHEPTGRPFRARIHISGQQETNRGTKLRWWYWLLSCQACRHNGLLVCVNVSSWPCTSVPSQLLLCQPIYPYFFFYPTSYLLCIIFEMKIFTDIENRCCHCHFFPF